MEVVLVAIIAGVVGPGILAYISGRQRSSEKREDWKRQDIVADRAEAAATAAQEAALALRVSQAGIISASTAQTVKLDTIHKLVNSQMTTHIQSELNATIRELAVLREIAEVRKMVGGYDPAAGAEAIRTSEGRVRELELTLEKRARQQIELDEAAAVAVAGA